MSAAGLAVWLLVLGPSSLEVGAVIPPGTYSAATLIQACAALDGESVVLETARLGDRPVTLRAPLTVQPTSMLAFEVLLRTAGLHRIRHVERAGEIFTYITTDPHRRPPPERGYSVRRWRVRHVEVDQVVEMLNTLVEAREGERAEADRTQFVTHAATGTLIARYHSEKDLEPYAELLEQLDRPPGEERAALRRWSPRRRLAAHVAPELEAAWQKQGMPALRLVVHRKSNSLLITAPPSVWPDLLALLDRLDRASDGELPKPDEAHPR